MLSVRTPLRQCTHTARLSHPLTRISRYRTRGQSYPALITLSLWYGWPMGRLGMVTRTCRIWSGPNRIPTTTNTLVRKILWKLSVVRTVFPGTDPEKRAHAREGARRSERCHMTASTVF